LNPIRTRIKVSAPSLETVFHEDVPVTDELGLVTRARQLDPEALTEIHALYYGPIFKYIAYRVDDRDAAQDLASEVFIRLIDALKANRAPQQTLKGWLYGAATNVINEHRRKQKRSIVLDLDESMESTDPNPEALIEMGVDQADLRAALDELTKEQQMVITLRFGSGLSIREIAGAMGKTEGAVKQLQIRAIDALTRRLVGVK
jgi:RNA polymerase sigma-70 factor, ECF subfamily